MDTNLKLALQLAQDKAPTASSVESVAAATSAEAASWAFTQWKLRSIARAKFAKAEQMLFVREALEQASDQRLAAYHASRFAAGAPVADLTVGIGADLIALARRGPVVGFEIDPERADCARHNLSVHGLEGDVRLQDCLAEPLGLEYAFADPSRRVEGRRTSDPGLFEPDPQALAERLRGLKLGGMKLSPMLPDSFLAAFEGRLEFASLGRECREAIVWLGAEAGAGTWAVHVESSSVLAGGGEVETVPWPEDFLFEADPAAIRAHCLGSLCDTHDLRALGDSNGYLTGPASVDSPWLRGYRVLARCSADDKATKAKLRELGVGVFAAKARGPKVDVEALVRRYRGYGDPRALLVVYAEGMSRRHAIVEPVG
jgi:hypothetical protein